MTRPDVVLVGCAAAKLDHPAPVRELITSPLFLGACAVAEASGAPWFVVSSEHGLLAPHDVVGPYDRVLARQPAAYRAAWGAWVVAKLATEIELDGATVEIHAGPAYVDAVVEPLADAGATLVEPLAGLTMGERADHYASLAPSRTDTEVQHVVQQLSDSAQRTPARDLARLRATLRDSAGLYAWWVDDAGAADLGQGLGLDVAPGVVYAGQAGGADGGLWGRLSTMGQGDADYVPTFRLSLGSVLRRPLRWTTAADPRLTSWMMRHLEVGVVTLDAAAAQRLAPRVLQELDPLLNLRDLAETPARKRLAELREHARRDGVDG